MIWQQLQSFLDTPSNRHERGILKAEPLGAHVLEIWFEDNRDVAIYELDFLPILKAPGAGPALKPLLDEARFQQVSGRYTLTWLNPENGEYDEQAIDLAPETVRWFCEHFGKRVR